MSHRPVTEVCNCGLPGWMPDVVHAPSTAVGGPCIPDSAIVHTIEGWQSTMMSPSWTINSYHFTLRHQDGRIVQHVPIDRQAWHSGNVESPTWRRYRPGVNPNAHAVGISAEGRAHPGGMESLPLAWSEPQVQGAIRVLAWVGRQRGITWDGDTLTEHSAVAVRSRRDPGPRWPKGRVLDALAPRQEAPVTLTREQQEMVDLVRANRQHLTDADVAYVLSTVGLSAMPGEAPPPTPPPAPSPPPPAGQRDRKQEVEDKLAQAARLVTEARQINAAA